MELLTSLNWLLLLDVAAKVVAGASMIVWAFAKLTPNTKDDKVATWLDKALGLLSKLALNPAKK